MVMTMRMIYSACTRLYFYVCFCYALIRFWVPFCIHISRLAANNNNVSNDRSAHRHTQSILLFLVHCTLLLFLDGIFLSTFFWFLLQFSKVFQQTLSFTWVATPTLSTLGLLSSMNHNDRKKKWTQKNITRTK